MGSSESKQNEDDAHQEQIRFLQEQLAAEQRAKERQVNEATETRRRMKAVEEIKDLLEKEKRKLIKAQKDAEIAENIRRDKREDAIREESRVERLRQESRQDRLRQEDLREAIRLEEREDRRRMELEDEEVRRFDRAQQRDNDFHLRDIQLRTLKQEHDAAERDKDRDLERFKILEQNKLEMFQLELKAKVIGQLAGAGYKQEVFVQILSICMTALQPSSLALTGSSHPAISAT